MKDSEGNELPLARMILRQQGWHGSANVQENISLADVHTVLGTSSRVNVSPLQYPDGRVCSFAQGVRWEDAELGVVGPSYVPLQNDDFINSFAPWLDSGMATIEGAGLLRGGAVIYLQLNPTALDPIEIRPDDAVRSKVFGVNGHDGKTGIRLGSCDERIVCMNTLGVALREVQADEEAGKKNSFSRKHTGAVVQKMSDIQAQLMMMRASLNKHAELWKFLDSRAVKNTEEVYKFARAWQNKSPELGADFRPNKVEIDIEYRFRHGKGNLGKSYWDLLNAATERNAWGKGNALADDRVGDAEARRLDALWLGTLASSNQRAFSVAMSMAKNAA